MLFFLFSLTLILVFKQPPVGALIEHSYGWLHHCVHLDLLSTSRFDLLKKKEEKKISLACLVLVGGRGVGGWVGKGCLQSLCLRVLFCEFGIDGHVVVRRFRFLQLKRQLLR